MINFKRPMLAAPLLPASVEHTDANILAAMQKLRYPVLATVKLDGIRAIRLGGTIVSRTLKEIPNRSIRERSLVLPAGFDMELYNLDLSYEQIESIVMSREHKDSNKIKFFLLDRADLPTSSYSVRLDFIGLFIKDYNEFNFNFSFERPSLCKSADELMNIFLFVENNGGEGICFRTPNSPYKQGRSTLKEQYLIKLCRFHYAECTIIGFKEAMYNGNRMRRNALGSVDRSHSKSRLVPKGMLGALVCRDIKTGLEFDIGTGFTEAQRKEIWLTQEQWLQKTITYKHKGGGKNLPRCPVFTRERKME